MALILQLRVHSRPIHRWGRNSFRKRQETWRFRTLHFPAGRSSTPLASECSTFPEWYSTSTMDRLHGEWRLDTSVLATEVSRSYTLRLFLVGVCKRCSLRTTSSQEFEWPKKLYHSCGELSDARHSSSSLGWIQLPSRSGVFNLLSSRANLHLSYNPAGRSHCRLKNDHGYIKHHHRGLSGSPDDVDEMPMT